MSNPYRTGTAAHDLYAAGDAYSAANAAEREAADLHAFRVSQNRPSGPPPGPSLDDVRRQIMIANPGLPAATVEREAKRIVNFGAVDRAKADFVAGLAADAANAPAEAPLTADEAGALVADAFGWTERPLSPGVQAFLDRNALEGRGKLGVPRVDPESAGDGGPLGS